MARFVKKRAARALALLLVFVLAAGGLSATLHAETPAEKYKRLKEELEATRANITAYKDDLSRAREHKEALEEEKAIIDEMVEVNKGEIARTEGELEAKEIEIADKRQVIYENDQLLQQRLIAIYKMNDASLLTQALNVDGFSELFVIMDGMQRISKHDTDLLEMLNGQRAQLEIEQADIDALLAELENYRLELLQNQEDLANNITATDNRISNAEAQIEAQKAIEGEQQAALLQAQREMQALAGRIGGSRSSDGSTYVGGVFTWPVPGYYTISDHFGGGHRGMDISTNRQIGPDIVACNDGTVILASYAHNSWGNYIVVDHGAGVHTLYAHCQALYASVGTFVAKGQAIASVGSTGYSTGPHLHLEVMVDGALQDPAGWLRG